MLFLLMFHEEAAEGACAEREPKGEDERFGVRRQLGRPNPENEEEGGDRNQAAEKSFGKCFRRRQIEFVFERKVDSDSGAKTRAENVNFVQGNEQEDRKGEA